MIYRQCIFVQAWVNCEDFEHKPEQPGLFFPLTAVFVTSTVPEDKLLRDLLADFCRDAMIDDEEVVAIAAMPPRPVADAQGISRQPAGTEIWIEWSGYAR